MWNWQRAMFCRLTVSCEAFVELAVECLKKMSTDDAFLLVTCELMMLDVNHGNALARAIFADQVKQHAGRLLAAASSPTSAFLPSEPNARIFLRAALASA